MTEAASISSASRRPFILYNFARLFSIFRLPRKYAMKHTEETKSSRRIISEAFFCVFHFFKSRVFCGLFFSKKRTSGICREPSGKASDGKRHTVVKNELKSPTVQKTAICLISVNGANKSMAKHIVVETIAIDSGFIRRFLISAPEAAPELAAQCVKK